MFNNYYIFYFTIFLILLDLDIYIIILLEYYIIILLEYYFTRCAYAYIRARNMLVDQTIFVVC
jgi:hypothetical protein